MIDRIEQAEGYYALPRITEPFEGDVIQLTARELNMFYQTYSMDGNQERFIEKLINMDEWFEDKQYKLYKDGKWIKYVTKWLQRDKDQYIERENS